jgi:hypothetical protein
MNEVCVAATRMACSGEGEANVQRAVNLIRRLKLCRDITAYSQGML